MTKAVKLGMNAFLGLTKSALTKSALTKSALWQDPLNWNGPKDIMAKRLKPAPELERLILLEMRRHAVCAGIAAVTVRETSDQPETNWAVAHINALGGAVPKPVRRGGHDSATGI